MLHADETGGNIDGRRHWLYVLGTDRYGCSPSLCQAHPVRELTFAQEEEKQTGVGELKQQLLDASAEIIRQGSQIEALRAAEIQKLYRAF